MILYTAEKTHFLSADYIGRAIGLPAIMVETHIRSIMHKKVPVIANINDDGSLNYSLDEEFRSIQRKYNILGVEERDLRTIHI